MPPAAEISVVISAYTMNRWDELVAAVRSVAELQRTPPREVFVVVDGNEELLEKARVEIPTATVVPNEDVPGLSGARMTGYRHAHTPVIAFLDDDAQAEPQWIEEMAAAYVDPEVLGTGGTVVPRWETERPRWMPAELDWVVGCSWTGTPTTRTRIRNPIGANMSMRGDVLERTGGFAGALGRLERGGKTVVGTADETELAMRSARLFPGGFWLFCPEQRVHHLVTAERATWPYFVRRCRLEGASKAILRELSGPQTGLDRERRYVTSVLPRAVLRELGAALRGDVWGLARAGAIVAGLSLTSWSYLTGRRGAAQAVAERTAQSEPRPSA